MAPITDTPANKIFSLEGKSLKLDTAEQLEPHIAPLRAMGDVEEVRFSGNTLGMGACKLLGEVLSTKKSLRTANFADIFTGRLIDEIPTALSSLLTSILNLPHLNTVNLNDNAFGLRTHAPLGDFLSAHVPLEHLYLNNNGLGPHAGIYIADALAELHAKKEAARTAGQTVPHLETVVCGRNRLENGSMMAWARAFALHRHVRRVVMVQNGIWQDGIAHLIRAGLSHAADLRILNLQDNTLTRRGARALAATVPRWPDLEELGVADSLLRRQGAIQLIDALALAKNPHLRLVHLQYNEITADAVQRLADVAAAALPALQRVELNGNKLAEDDEGVMALQTLLEKRKSGSAKGDADGDDDDDDDDAAWGLDSLSDLEGLGSDEEDEEDKEDMASDDEEKERNATLAKAAKEAQEVSTLTQKKAKEVEALAELLEKTSI